MTTIFSLEADDVRNKYSELINDVLDAYDDESIEAREAVAQLTSHSRNATKIFKQDDEQTMNHAVDTWPNDEINYKPPKPYRCTYTSRNSKTLKRKNTNALVTWFVLVVLCHLSPLVGAYNDKNTGSTCVSSTKNYKLLKTLLPKDDCGTILQQYSCESNHVKACIRDINHTFLVAVCTPNLCLLDKACAEYQSAAHVINTRSGECSRCLMTDNLKARMERGDGKECLELKSDDPTTTHGTSQTTTGTGTHVAVNQIAVGMLLFIAAVLSKILLA
ncbi:uncharacterized protein LOC134237292 isoform X1 [Saccostrea cucullata]|uniref:uncharacterized protein LOC134237292 isoform X1 n=1 Tax=Saccostrea cuccullata TaxID=36930 RepID=UPI002ED46435